jgi:hypothetical protein
MTPPPVAGVLEGFYGRPWSWDERVEVSRWCAARGMTDYVYAPKDDPKHREAWREPYQRDELAGFERLASEGGLRLGFAISPGLSMAYDDAEERRTLARKIDRVVSAGARHVMLALDDIAFGGREQGEAHARLTTWLRHHLDGEVLVTMVPTEYVGTRPSPYLDALAGGVPHDVPIGWTGRAVVNDTVTAADVLARASTLGGRPPLLWDNYPVNDALMADLLPLGPLRGRDADLPSTCTGYLANAAVQPRASTLPLASTAAWLRGDDPVAAWETEADALGWRTLAASCDGELPRMLVERLIAGDDAAAAETFFADAANCTAPGLEREAQPWIDQTCREAEVGLSALRLLAAARVDVPDHDLVVIEAMGTIARWRGVRTATTVVMGERWAFRPALLQSSDGRWALDRATVIEDRNAVDTLVRHALDAAARLASSA